MLTVIAHALLAAGGYSCALALMRAYRKLFPLLIGIALIGLGFGVLHGPAAKAPGSQSDPHAQTAPAGDSIIKPGSNT